MAYITLETGNRMSHGRIAKGHLNEGRSLRSAVFSSIPATIFAYGQTGSGKTHTMMGGDTPDGIIPRLNAQLFSEVQVWCKKGGTLTEVTPSLYLANEL